jgi:hypothetical protein
MSGGLNIMNRLAVAAALSLALGANAAPAEDVASTPTVRLQGTIEQAGAAGVVIHAKDGSSPKLAIGPKTVIFATRPAKLEDIKAGDFIASAAVRGADGKLRSSELRIFPEALRGLGEGQRPMNAPNQTMTNASVYEVAAGPEGRVIRVKFEGGESELIVGPDVPISALIVTGPDSLKVGEKVFVMASKSADGSLTALRIFAN